MATHDRRLGIISNMIIDQEDSLCTWDLPTMQRSGLKRIERSSMII